MGKCKPSYWVFAEAVLPAMIEARDRSSPGKTSILAAGALIRYGGSWLGAYLGLL
jgi:hypothetical protein